MSVSDHGGTAATTTTRPRQTAIAESVLSSKWAGGVADTHRVRHAAIHAQGREATSLREERDGLVVGEGSAFLDRVEGALQSVATLFNERLGSRVVDAYRAAARLGIRLTDSTSWVLIVPDMLIGDSSSPGLAVTTEQRGRSSTVHYAFVNHNGRLHVERAGDIDNPESFVRRVVEPWLLALPLEGR